MTNATRDRYIEPDVFTRRVLNPSIVLLTRAGISVWGSRILGVTGRRSGELREVPVNLLTVEGQDFLVAPRGVTQWVRNLRAAGAGTLRVGRRTERFTAVELADAHKPAVLRPYLARWRWEVGQFFDGLGADASDEDLVAAGPKHPVFRIERQAPGS